MKKFVYFAALAASMSLSLASCSQDEPVAQASTSYSSEVVTRDGYDPYGSHINKYGAFLTDGKTEGKDNINNKQTLEALKNAMWSSSTTNYFKGADQVNEASFIMVSKKDALNNKQAVIDFYNQDKPVVVLEPGTDSEMNWWLGEMGDATMKTNVSANISVAYTRAQGKHIAAIFTKNRAIVVDADGYNNPYYNAKYIIENLNSINTQATVKVNGFAESANDQVCKVFVNSLSGIDANHEYANFLVIGKKEAENNKALVEQFFAANKPVVMIGSDIASLDTDRFKTWATSMGGTVKNVANVVGNAFNTTSLSGIHRAVIFNKTRVMVVDDVRGDMDYTQTSAAIWANLQANF